MLESKCRLQAGSYRVPTGFPQDMHPEKAGVEHVEIGVPDGTRQPAALADWRREQGRGVCSECLQPPSSSMRHF